MILFRIARAILKPIAHLIFKLSCEGRDNVPEKGPAIIASNHINLVDPGLQAFCCRRTFRSMAKVELFKHPLTAFLLRPLGAFPVRRGKADKRAFNTASTVLEKGHVLLIFPEGTRSKTTETGTFKAGAVALCAMTKAPIIPSAIVEPKGLKIGNTVKVKYGEPMTYEQLGLSDTSSANLRRASEKVREAVVRLMEEK